MIFVLACSLPVGLERPAAWNLSSAGPKASLRPAAFKSERPRTYVAKRAAQLSLLLYSSVQVTVCASRSPGSTAFCTEALLRHCAQKLNFSAGTVIKRGSFKEIVAQAVSPRRASLACSRCAVRQSRATKANTCLLYQTCWGPGRSQTHEARG